MDDVTKVGRIIGGLMLVKLVLGPIQNFTLMEPVTADPGFLVNAAAHPQNLPLAVMILFVLALVSIATLVVAYPVFRRAAPALTLWFAALTLVGVTLGMVEGMTLMSMQSLSLSFGAAAGADPAQWEGLKLVVGKARFWAHYAHLQTGSLALFVMFLLLYWVRLVPRPLAGFGLAAIAVQQYSLLRPYFGLAVDFQLLMPVGLAMLALVLWLLWRGFAAPAVAER